jgi:hypothetical protein
MGPVSQVNERKTRKRRHSWHPKDHESHTKSCSWWHQANVRDATQQKIKWMTDELRELNRERRRAERKLKNTNNRTTENITNYQRLKATTRMLLKRAKKEE